jgi:DNA-directed RNA polymerase specialized sigma subunit
MTVQDDDLQHWQTWKHSPTPENLSALVGQVQPLLYRATQINQGSLPPAVIEAQAKLEAKKAFQSFDPKRGVKLSTHVTNYLQKVNRLNYKYQEIYAVPENRRIKFTAYQTAKDDLAEDLGREPNLSELSSHLHWSQAEVARFNSEGIHELSDNQPYMSDANSNDTADDTLVSYAYNDLLPNHKVVFEHTTGYGGKPIMSGHDLMKKLDMTQGQLSYAKSRIKEAFKKAMKRV